MIMELLVLFHCVVNVALLLSKSHCSVKYVCIRSVGLKVWHHDGLVWHHDEGLYSLTCPIMTYDAMKWYHMHVAY